MSAEVVPLRECCRRTAEHYEHQLTELGQDFHNANLELAKNRREITRLKNLLANRDKTSKLRPHAEEIFEFWRDQIHPQARAFGAKRLKNVLDRLGEGKDDLEGRKQEIREAILGAATDAYVSPEGVRYDDLELICRDETYIRRFRGAYKARQDSLGTPHPRLTQEERGFLKLLEAGRNPFEVWPEPPPPSCAYCEALVDPRSWVCTEHEERFETLMERVSNQIRLQEAAGA